jgi:hypothetical protein
MTKSLKDEISKQCREPTHAIVSDFAADILKRHSGVVVVLAYGSALRESNPENTLIDFYIVTEQESGITKNRVSQFFCKLISPNVYYAEFKQGAHTYRAKYAALTLNTLQDKVQPKTSNPYFWARFAQPVRLIWSRDETSAAAIIRVLADAINTAYTHAVALRPEGSVQDQWTALFENTYPTELRPESAARAAQIVAANIAHYETISKLAEVVEPSPKPWSTRRWQGKLLSVARLLKAAMTFQGGADYAAWKIKRHSGVDIEIKNWHRRHPIVASIVLLPKLLKSRALK